MPIHPPHFNHRTPSPSILREPIVRDSDVTLRIPGTEDLAYLMSIDWDAYPEKRWPGDMFCRTATRFCYLAEVRGTDKRVSQIAGYVVFTDRGAKPLTTVNSQLSIVNSQLPPAFEHRITINRLTVKEDLRKRGIGRKLLEILLRPECPATHLQTDVLESNLPAQLFLQSLGFRAAPVNRLFRTRNALAEWEQLYRFVRPAGGYSSPNDPVEAGSYSNAEVGISKL